MRFKLTVNYFYGFIRCETCNKHALLNLNLSKLYKHNDFTSAVLPQSVMLADDLAKLHLLHLGNNGGVPGENKLFSKLLVIFTFKMNIDVIWLVAIVKA